VYLVPRRDGRILVGATVEEAGFDRSVDEGVARQLRRAAVTLVPGLEDSSLRRQWAGLRPGTPDGLPILGPDPELEGVYYATGHYRNGILLGPLTAQVTAAVVTGRSPGVNLAPFSIDRPSLMR
jgi:glycine oxidase